MTDHEARHALASAHSEKARLSQAEARRRASAARDRTGHRIFAYPCPFSHITGNGRRHWHIGHVPSPESIERLALAMRYLRDRPHLLEE